MRHGYTNATWVDDAGRVVKHYLGPDAAVRQRHETDALIGLAGKLPVPPLLEQEAGQVVLGLLPGVPGQERLEIRPEEVLYAVGQMARRVQRLDPGLIAALAQTGPRTVLVHGDFGPQNMLFDAGTGEVLAVLDWEMVHRGDPVEDLAWAEWIVRTHHVDRVSALPSLFDGFGERPAWSARQAAMLTACQRMLELARRWPGTDGRGVVLWQQRLATTRAFRD